ncbi:MAG: AAA family ATPase [Arcobacteraceae bacterium]|nr:AAA family ATPase [Arcobacteraceae bacterium]MDY0327747.1 AAA family ATPase [Arcobacteraceae bacterium]
MYLTKIKQLKNELSHTIIGQEQMIDALLIGLFCNGHIILESVPGLAKTTTIKTLAKALELSFSRIQFTPDLLPSDIIGAQIYNPKTHEFGMKKGPIFTNLLLADEINRAPAKVQSALLEVMQEKQVTIGGESIKLDEPFLVLATQNPIDQMGSYELPQAQLDRFMLKVTVGYNSKEEELKIAQQNSHQHTIQTNKILDATDIKQIVEEVSKVYIDDVVQKYMIELIFASRNPLEYSGLEEIAEFIEFGASPRASIDLFKASKAYAYLKGDNYVNPDHIASIIKSVLRHRIVLNFSAMSQNITTDMVIDKIIQKVPIP